MQRPNKNMPVQSLLDTGAIPKETFRSVGNGNPNQELTQTKATHPRYSTIQSRKASFHKQKGMCITSKEAIEAGFFHTGKDDLLKCYHCNVGLKSWKKGDDPMKEHASHSPQCGFLMLKKGPDYIKKAGRTYNKLSNDEWKDKFDTLEFENAVSLENYRKKIEQLQQEIDLLRGKEIQLLQKGVVEHNGGDGNPNRKSENRISQECQDNEIGELAIARCTAKEYETPSDNVNMETGKSDLTSPKVYVTDNNPDEELQGAVGGGMEENSNMCSVALEAVAEYGYSKESIQRAVRRLQKEKRLSYTAGDLVEILLEMEENENSIEAGSEIPNEETDLQYHALSFKLLKE